jgi:hypothetical protein
LAIITLGTRIPKHIVANQLYAFLSVFSCKRKGSDISGKAGDVRRTVTGFVTGKEDIRSVRRKPGMYMGYLAVHGTTVFTEYPGPVIPLAVPDPQKNIPARRSVSHCQGMIVGVDMGGTLGELPFDSAGSVKLYASQETLPPIETVVTYTLAVGVPVFMAYTFSFGPPFPQGPDLAGTGIHGPDPLIHQFPGAFMTKGQMIGVKGRRIKMSQPDITAVNNIGLTAAVYGNPDDLGKGFEFPAFPEPYVAVPHVDFLYFVREILTYGEDKIVTIRGNVNHVGNLLFGKGKKKPDFQGRKGKGPEFVVIPVGRFVGYPVDTDTVRIYSFPGVVISGKLCYLPIFQVNAKKISTVVPVASHKELFTPTVPARIGKVEVITMPFIRAQTDHFHTGEGIRIFGPFYTPVVPFFHRVSPPPV